MKQLREIRAVFDAYKVTDENEEYIPRSIVAQALWDLEINPTFELLDQLFEDDKDAGGKMYYEGKVDMTEFKLMYLGMFRKFALNPQHAVSAFICLDENRNGSLDRDELRNAVCGEAGTKLSPGEFETFWRELDKDENNAICAAEFVLWMLQDVDPGEIDRYLAAYGIEENSQRFKKAAPPPAAAQPAPAEADKTPAKHPEANGGAARRRSPPHPRTSARTPQKVGTSPTPSKKKQQEEERRRAAEQRMQEEQRATDVKIAAEKSRMAEDERRRKEGEKRKKDPSEEEKRRQMEKAVLDKKRVTAAKKDDDKKPTAQKTQ